jgi:CRP/FNR family cyclic AMP-dependent transcriptional regulator
MKIDKAIYARYVRAYTPGETIFEEGKSGDMMYVIVEGEVEIRKRTSRTATKTLALFHAGDIFGEMALIEKKPRSATAIAIQPSKLLAMNDKLLEAMIDGNPDFARKMIRMLAERLRKSNAIIQTITANNRQEQIMSELHRFAREQGQTTFKGLRINLEDFVTWAQTHLGIKGQEVRAVLDTLGRRGLVKPSALGSTEILIPDRRL